MSWNNAPSWLAGELDTYLSSIVTQCWVPKFTIEACGDSAGYVRAKVTLHGKTPLDLASIADMMTANSALFAEFFNGPTSPVNPRGLRAAYHRDPVEGEFYTNRFCQIFASDGLAQDLRLQLNHPQAHARIPGFTEIASAPNLVGWFDASLAHAKVWCSLDSMRNQSLQGIPERNCRLFDAKEAPNWIRSEAEKKLHFTNVKASHGDPTASDPTPAQYVDWHRLGMLAWPTHFGIEIIGGWIHPNNLPAGPFVPPKKRDRPLHIHCFGLS